MSSLHPAERLRETVGVAAIALLMIAAVAVSIVLTRTSVSRITPPVALVEELPRVNGGKIAIDIVRIDGKQQGPDAFKHPISSGAQIDVFGWATDEREGDAAAGIVLFIDGHPHLAGYGNRRPDLVAALGNARYLRAGFHLHVNPHTMKPGSHRLEWGVVAHSGIRVWIARVDEIVVRP